MKELQQDVMTFSSKIPSLKQPLTLCQLHNLLVHLHLVPRINGAEESAVLIDEVYRMYQPSRQVCIADFLQFMLVLIDD
jgi:hypothetical protein